MEELLEQVVNQAREMVQHEDSQAAVRLLGLLEAALLIYQTKCREVRNGTR